MCRSTWTNEPLLTHLHLSEDLHPASVQTYLDWLYSGTLRIDANISRKTDTFNVHVLRTWEVAIAVQDNAFKDAVMQTWFDEAEAQFGMETVQWAFVDGRGNEEIQKFVVEVFMCFVEKGWFKSQAKKWPRVFRVELADASLEGMGRRESYEELKMRYAGGIGTEPEQKRQFEA